MLSADCVYFAMQSDSGPSARATPFQPLSAHIGIVGVEQLRLRLHDVRNLGRRSIRRKRGRKPHARRYGGLEEIEVLT